MSIIVWSFCFLFVFVFLHSAVFACYDGILNICHFPRTIRETASPCFPLPRGQPGYNDTECQNRKESTLPNILPPKTISRIGTWNVRSMYQGGKVITIMHEMQRYNLQELGLCEIRWTQVGQTILATGELILYSGHTETNSQHTEGV